MNASDWTAYEKSSPIKVDSVLTDPHAVTRAAADQLRAAHHKDRWEALHTKGPDTFHVRAHADSLDRMLRAIDALAKAFDERGFELRYQKGDDDFDGLAVCIGGEPIEFRLWEETLVFSHVRTARGLVAPPLGTPFDKLEFSAVASGQIDVVISRRKTCGGRSIWRDRSGRRLELQLNNIVLGLRKEAAARTNWRLRSETISRRVEEFHRKRAELEEQVNQERENVDELFAEVAAWQKAQTIRAYVAAVEALPVPKGKRRQRASWIAWAHEQADRCDPLTESPPSILDTPKKDYGELPEWEELPDELYEWP